MTGRTESAFPTPFASHNNILQKPTVLNTGTGWSTHITPQSHSTNNTYYVVYRFNKIN